MVEETIARIPRCPRVVEEDDGGVEVGAEYIAVEVLRTLPVVPVKMEVQPTSVRRLEKREALASVVGNGSKRSAGAGAAVELELIVTGKRARSA